jgi:hypothetical protein
MLGYIKDGSIVGQDFSFFKFNNPTQMFEIEPCTPGRSVCTARGYGQLNGPRDGSWYGNGKLYTLNDNIIFIEQFREADRAY